MTERYGPLLASFVERTDPTNAIIVVGDIGQLGGIESAEIRKVRGQMNRGRFTLLKSTNWQFLVREGRIVSLYQRNGVSDAAGRGLNREMGCFLILSVKERILRDGRSVVEVRGLGVEHLLTKFCHWEAIGKETIYTAHLTEAARAPWATTLSAGCPHGNESAALTTDANFLKGDEIRIQMDNGDWFIGHIRNPDPSGVPAGVIQMDPRIPGDATQGNAVAGRRARLSLDNLTGFAVGQRVVIDLDNGQTWTTVVDEVDLAEVVIIVRDGLPSAAAIGKAVRVYDYTEPALDDVEQIMAPASGWTVDFGEAGIHGTRLGSAHAPVGESVWDLLTVAAERSGEFFRIAPMAGGFIPRRQLQWLSGADSSGMTLYLRNGNADVAADTENIDRGTVLSLEREGESDLITRVYPLSGDGRIDLEYCSEEGLLRAAVEGFRVVLSTDLFTPDYVEFGSGVAAHGVLEGTVRFGNVSLPKKAGLRELSAAADGMLYQAMEAILESQEREYWRAEVHCHRALYPGQTVQVVNQVMAPTTTGTYYVLEVTERLEKGVIRSSLLLSRQPQLRPTAALKLGRELKAGQMAARRLLAVEESAGATVVGEGGGGTPGPHEHGEFLKVDGTRALVGNMAVNPGVTIDGVDLSEHAANPAAHHAPVTAADASLLVSGQALRVADTFAGAGLALSGGVASINTAAGQGTTLASDTIGVAADAAGGVMVGAAGVKVRLPANSGLAADSTGLYLAPTAVSATTTNSLSGSGHTHQVSATSDGKANPGQLLKTDGSGDSTLRYLTADKVRTPLIDTAAGTLTLAPAGALVDVGADMTFTGGARTIRSSMGNSLTLAPASKLLIAPVGGAMELQSATTVKTAHWASGFLGTGWGVTYDGVGDFRRVTADELIVQSFIADVARVRVGSLWVTPGAAMLAEPFTLPAVGGVGTLIVEDAPGGLANMPVFDAGDWVMVQVVSRAGGGLVVALAWGQVTGYVDGPGAGQQSWTFTCRQTSAAGQVAAAGSEVLGFAKSGAGWIQANTTDAAGAPYLGMTIWRGDNPYTDGNRLHFLRIGQLRGVTGVWEQGLHVGQAGARRLRASELAIEVHGARQSLYAGDGAQARVVAADVRLYRDASNFVTLTPNADGVATNVVSSGSGYFGQIDDSPDAPNAADWVANGTNTSGQLSVQLSDPSPWGAVFSVTARAVIAGTGFSSDTVRVYAQVVGADEVTPLTGEGLLATLASSVTQSVSVVLKPDTAATQAQWNGARLRLRWDYSINAAKEVIRLDPQVPSIAVGQGLPTGMDTGGDGFWVGAESGLYQLRLGKAAGVGLRWNGAALALRNSANQDVIALRADGTSEFARAMTLGPAGGIWQGSGSFAVPGTGLKLWRDGSGIGRLSSYSGGLEQMTINSTGQVVAGAGGVVLDRTGLQFVNTLIESTPGHPSAVRFRSGATGTYTNIHGYSGGLKIETIPTSGFGQELILSPGGTGGTGANLYGMFTRGVELNVRAGATGGDTALYMQPGSIAAVFNNQVGAFTVGGGLVVGSLFTTPYPGSGVIRLKARTTGVAVPPSDVIEKSAELYVLNSGGVLTLNIRFSNGVTRTLATS